jgi:DNA-binding transcriptional ArsR family regulator
MSAKPRRTVTAAATAGVVPLFAALGDETRLALVLRLGSGGPHSIAQLAAQSPYTRQAITKHLEVLSAAGLVRSDRRGRERIWNVEADRLDAARRYLDQVSMHWDNALGRLKQFVEDDVIK